MTVIALLGTILLYGLVSRVGEVKNFNPLIGYAMFFTPSSADFSQVKY